MLTLEEITAQIDALNERATELLGQAEGDNTKVAEVKSLITDEVKPQLDILTKDREIALQKVEFDAMSAEVGTLKEAMDELRKPAPTFAVGSVEDPEGKSIDSDPYSGSDSDELSYFNDIVLARRGVTEARERLTGNLQLPKKGGWSLSAEGKALTEGTGAQGGYLVRPQIERQLTDAREADNVLRGLCSVLNVNTNAIQLDQLGLSTTAGWVAELAQKPETTNMTLATITASVFTAAGLATISNQLLADSNPAIDQLVTTDLAKRLVAVEETAFLTGTGTGQPLGLLNTPGIGATALTATTVAGLLDAILDSISSVQTGFGQPSAIVMHPRTWTRIIKDRNTQGLYTIGSPYNATVNNVQSPRPVAGGTLFGVGVVLSNRIPTNLGTATNESRVIVGDFGEALILDRQGITVDQSEHVYFTSNQTVFRAETRVGFTAARTPVAFNVIGGAGLANG